MSVEFFLLVGFSLAVLAVLLANTEAELAQNAVLDKAVLSRSALDSMTSAVNYVFLQGNNSRVNFELFVPQGPVSESSAVCFLNASSNLSCFVGDLQGRLVFSRNLLVVPSKIEPECQTFGWKNVTVVNYDNNVEVYCGPL
ncbi:MAG: hypothetical protein ACE5DI_03590 [Candidatus Micrarchaeia archaeon]